ncbi:hypothetical protein ABPG72_006246 [Tetrahymena utriculariae]
MNSIYQRNIGNTLNYGFMRQVQIETNNNKSIYEFQYYLINMSKIFQKCPNSCEICYNSQTCYQCQQGYQFDQNNNCIIIYSQLFILNPDMNVCFCPPNSNLISGTCVFYFDPNCQTCSQTNIKQCKSCYPGFSLACSICQQIYLTYNSQVFTEEKAELIAQITQTTSQASFIGSSFLGLATNILSSSSFSILQNSLAILKLSYIFLLDIEMPNQIYVLLKPLKSQIPSQKIQFLNFFSSLIPENKIEYYSNNFKFAYPCNWNKLTLKMIHKQSQWIRYFCSNTGFDSRIFDNYNSIIKNLLLLSKYRN